MADWLQAESDVRPFVRVTFDSNAWQQVVRPDKHLKDPRSPDFRLLQQAVKDGDIAGFIVETVATLEGVKRVDRAAYLAGVSPAASAAARGSGIGRIRRGVHLHPGVAPILEDRLNEAMALGFKLLKVPRIGQPSPAIVSDPANFPVESADELNGRLERTSVALRAIEPRGVGKRQVDALGHAISRRVGKAGPWWANLDQATQAEITEVADAVGEWADGDSIAAHIAYQNDLFCTEDRAVAAGHSIMNAENRAWLESTYGVRFVSLAELASMLR